jgi:LacI family transcriptional regulator
MGIANSVKRPTISDVARLCGVSKTTVSIILNDAPASRRVPAETQQRVRDAAGQIGYRPSWRARALASKRTHTIGVLYAPPMPLIVRGNYEGIMAGINSTLHEHGYHVMFVPLGVEQSGWGDILLDQRLDGALVLSRLYPALATLLQQANMPVALVNADTDLPLPVCIADDFGGATQSTQHLLDLAHQRIAFFLGDQPPHYSVTQRTGGYRQAMEKAGLAQHVNVVTGKLDDFISAIVAGDAASRPTAIICYTHYLAITALRLLWERNVRVPEEISVAAFSNSFPVAEVIPPLTTVALPTEEMGRTAAEMVLEQIGSEQNVPPRRVVMPETLVVRKSTGSAPRQEPPGHAAPAGER